MLHTRPTLYFLTLVLITTICASSVIVNGQDIRVKIHIRGVSETKISLLPLSGLKKFKPVLEVSGVENGETAILKVAEEFLPGEFVLRFDYKEKPESTPYPSEKHMLLGNQSIELWLHPLFANNPDSTWFGKDEKENAAFVRFSEENARQKQKISLLQQFLMEYDQPESEFYEQGIKEYKKRREAYNQWIDVKAKEDSKLFASSLYRFSYLPPVSFAGNERDRLLSHIAHYFDGIDFNDPDIIKTAQMNEWMNSYVNLHGQMATSVALRDSLIPAAAFKAVEKAKTGNPLVYGWMVDYFYRGFESNDMPGGMKVLETYLNDSNCLTTRHMEIERRLKGMESLVLGVPAPDIVMNDKDNQPFQLSTYSNSEKFILLLFWSADCSHCEESLNSLYAWYQYPENKEKVSVVAISLDESDAELRAWEQKVPQLAGWKHLRAAEGINSKVAGDYFILATPVMILLDSKTREIVSLPASFSQLEQLLK